MEYPLGKVSISNKGAYSAGTNYTPLDLVAHRGGSFLCKAAVSGVEPGAGTGWRSYWVNVTRGLFSLSVSSQSAGTATVTLTLSDGTTETFSFTTTALADGSVTTQKLASGAVTGAKTNFSAGLPVNGPMLLSSGIGYGDSLPSSGSEGQIFFLRVQ